jgi:hypothetical protein
VKLFLILIIVALGLGLGFCPPIRSEATALYAQVSEVFSDSALPDVSSLAATECQPNASAEEQRDCADHHDQVMDKLNPSMDMSGQHKALTKALEQ